MSEAAREPPPDILHIHTPVDRKQVTADFASRDYRRKPEKLIEIPTKGNNTLHKYGKALREPRMKELVACIRELGHEK